MDTIVIDGYCYRLNRKNPKRAGWRCTPDAAWETVVRSRTECRKIGERSIDGSTCIVVRAFDTGEYLAVLSHALAS